MPAPTFEGFRPELFKFLGQLARNNRRDWFEKNKARYESEVREPCLEFIRTMQPKLKKISPHFEASDRRVGGSLMRIYRDTRFSKDKSPYKTNVGIQFRHELGRDVHSPGYYLHLEPKQVFLGVGIWHPDSRALSQIRDAIVENGSAWKRARDARKFRAEYTLAGESLKTAPRGYDKDHPLVEDLRRKDFIAVREMTEQDVLNPLVVDIVAGSFAASRPFMRFLCDALKVPF